MGTDLMNPKWGPRHVAYSYNEEEHGQYGRVLYTGECSNDTNEPHGRGIQIYDSGAIFIGYFYNGEKADTGKYIRIDSNGDFVVGENTVDAQGNHSKGTIYFAAGTSRYFKW